MESKCFDNYYKNILIPFAWLHRATHQTKLVHCYLFIKLSMLMPHIHVHREEIIKRVRKEL